MGDEFGAKTTSAEPHAVTYIVWDLGDVVRDFPGVAVARAASLGVTQQVDDQRKAFDDFLQNIKDE